MKSSSVDPESSALRPALMLGLLAAAFFSVSFVLNRQMSQANEHWAWSASLRFLMMAPVIAMVIGFRRQWGKVWQMAKASPLGWCLWGFLSCVLFYAPLVAACAVAPAWLVAATWPVSIVIGIMLSPLIYKDSRRVIPRSALWFSALIVAGVILLQAGAFRIGEHEGLWLGLVLVLVSAIAHPLGNRGSMLLMEKAGLPADPLLRLFLMILGSLPFWFILCGWGWIAAGPPSSGQWFTVGIVAATGLIATPMFYAAADRVSKNPKQLAAVEATQAAEIVFTLILEAILIGIHPPSLLGWFGLVLIFAGFLLHARPGRGVQHSQ